MSNQPKIKEEQIKTIKSNHQFARLSSALFIKEDQRYVPVTSDHFARIAYQHFPYASIAQIKEAQHHIAHTAQSLDHSTHLISFPSHTWDTRTHRLKNSTDSPYFCPYDPDPAHAPQVLTYLTQLAAGDSRLAKDYLYAIAPLFLERKPTGIIWFVGDGANGKSSLISLVYRLLGPHLTSLTVRAIEDGRDTPNLNGRLGNVCRESSESRVEDTERYKTLGTHEDFEVHKFHSQDSITINGNIHTIMNANNIPVFADKTDGTKRRTIIVPFPARFSDDPTFEDRTFTTPFIQAFLHLVLEAAKEIAANHYVYPWSKATRSAKEEYDSDINSAEAFLRHLRQQKVVAFDNYRQLQIRYENWCADQGYVPLGRTTLKRAMTKLAKAESRQFRINGGANMRLFTIDGKDNKNDWTYLEGTGIWVDTTGSARDTSIPTQPRLGEEW